MSLSAIGVNTLRLIHAVARGPANEWLSLATINGYDPAAHKVSCTLQPVPRTTGAIPVLGAWPGMAHPLRPGMQGLVAMALGTPLAFVGTLPSDADPPPDAAMSVDGDIFLSGMLSAAGGLALSPGEVLPTASATYRGQVLLIGPSVGGVADKLYICLASAAGSYSWVLIATG